MYIKTAIFAGIRQNARAHIIPALSGRLKTTKNMFSPKFFIKEKTNVWPYAGTCLTGKQQPKGKTIFALATPALTVIRHGWCYLTICRKFYFTCGKRPIIRLVNSKKTVMLWIWKFYALRLIRNFKSITYDTYYSACLFRHRILLPQVF